MERIRHMRSLDGLRFVSYTLVFGFHAMPMILALGVSKGTIAYLSWLELGWIGVDIFFVLSGFLITLGLNQNIQRSDYLRRFYVKRVLRIFPLYYAVCFAAFVILPILLPKVRLLAPGLNWSWPVFCLHLQNWSIASGDLNAAYLGHFWTLAIEEQFYLLWPLGFLLIKNRSRPYAIMFALIIAIVGLRICAAMLPNMGMMLHYSTASRIDGLLIGCLLAMLLSDGYCLTYRPVLPFVCLSLLGLLAFMLVFWPSEPIDNYPTQTIGYTLIALAAASVISVLQDERFDKSILGREPMVYLGRISYGLYVFHWPLLYFTFRAFQSLGMDGWQFAMVFVVINFLLTICVASISYHFFERPFLLLKPKDSPCLATDVSRGERAHQIS